MSMPLQPPLWRSRHQAGLELAERFQDHPDPDNLLLALPRGGVPVAIAMAGRLHCPVATWSVRKVADPHWPELAIGAVAHGGVSVWRNGHAGLQRQAMARSQGWLQTQEDELLRRQSLFGDPSAEALRGRPLIVVDDGIATGMTVKAALLSLRQAEPRRLTLAVPVVDRSLVGALSTLVDHLEALAIVDRLESVGMWYESFPQLSDREVLELLAPMGPRPI